MMALPPRTARARRRFLRRYRRAFAAAEQPASAPDDAGLLHTQRMFQRLLLLAFLERAGISPLGGQGSLRALWDTYRQQIDSSVAFYRDHVAALVAQAEMPILRAQPNEDSAASIPDAALAALIELLYDADLEISELAPESTAALDPEMLGTVLEALMAERHGRGRYYTPRPVVAFMCREALKGYLEACLPGEAPEAIALLVDERDPGRLQQPAMAQAALLQVRACDPACGSGAYLVGMLRELLALRAALEACLGAPSDERAWALAMIRDNLYGVELDPFALENARVRLWLALVALGHNGQPPSELDTHLKAADSLTLDWRAEFAQVFARGGFDLVLANPPYLSSKHGFGRNQRSLLADAYRTATGQYDAYGLFIELALGILAPDGCYAYIVPKPVLANRNMQPIRNLMGRNRLLALADPGQVFAAGVEPFVIIGQRQPQDGRPVRWYAGPAGAGGQVIVTSVDSFVTASGIWHLAATAPAVASHDLAGAVQFGDLFEIMRGVECGKRDACIARIPAEQHVPLLRGEDVFRYGFHFQHFYIRPDGNSPRFKPAQIYRDSKLLIRRVSNHLIAAVDQAGHYVLNTLYVARPKPGCPVALEYVCAALNSRWMNGYFHSIYLNDDRLFPYIRKEQIARLPIILPTPAQHDQIVGLVRTLPHTNRGEPSEQIEQLLEDLYIRLYRE